MAIKKIARFRPHVPKPPIKPPIGESPVGREAEQAVRILRGHPFKPMGEKMREQPRKPKERRRERR